MEKTKRREDKRKMPTEKNCERMKKRKYESKENERKKDNKEIWLERK